jgi:adenylate cyclase
LAHHYPLHYLGLAYFAAGKYATAASLFRERVVLVPSTDMSRGFLAAALCQIGRFDEAREVWNELMAINPDWRLRARIEGGMAIGVADVDRLLEGLRRAGIEG